MKKKLQKELESYFLAKNINLGNIISYFNDDAMIDFYNKMHQSIQHYVILLENDPFSNTTKNLLEKMNSKYDGMPQSIDNLMRMAEQSNYHHLVYLKYRIERDKINNQDIPQFLESMGELAKHPVTQVPYTWNARKRTLSIPLAEKKFLPSNIWSNRMTHFKVWIR